MSVLSTVASAVKNAFPVLRDAGHTLTVAYERVAEIDGEIEAFTGLMRPPYQPSRDELVESFCGHLGAGFEDYVKRNHINEDAIARMTYTTFAAHPGAHLLAVDTVPPSQPSTVPAVVGSGAQPTMRALEWALAPLLRQRFAELVDAVLPPGYQGITKAERAAKLAKLQSERKKLVDEIAGLEKALREAGLTVAAPTTTGTDAEILTARQRAEAFVAGRIDRIIGISPDVAVDQVEAAIKNGGDIDAALAAEQK